HDATTVAGLERVLWLEDGRLLEDGSPAQLAADPDSRYSRWIVEQRSAEADDRPAADAPPTPAPAAAPTVQEVLRCPGRPLPHSRATAPNAACGCCAITPASPAPSACWPPSGSPPCWAARSPQTGCGSSPTPPC